ATRATGIIALLLLTATVVLGVSGIARTELPGLPRVVTAGLHRNLSLITVVFVALHVVTVLVTPYLPLRWFDVLVPGTALYNPVPAALGAVALDLLLAVLLTSLLRGRLPYRAWRAVHWLGYACWPVALWHGLGTGTDTRLPWLLALDALCAAADAPGTMLVTVAGAAADPGVHEIEGGTRSATSWPAPARPAARC
ncbi:MAG TPA: ferric reductase-like transmembrane domain-containing protein, partial [Streptosporangiaceae bacterium]|nr:ferric reductase-like transmembrane domain-containing protein [Streptosporangiaceae bacterium]